VGCSVEILPDLDGACCKVLFGTEKKLLTLDEEPWQKAQQRICSQMWPVANLQLASHIVPSSQICAEMVIKLSRTL
jgi:hypothetical protein